MITGERLGRHRVGAEGSPGRDPIAARLTAAIAAFFERRTAASALIVVRERHTVPWRDLRSQATRDDLPALGHARFNGLIERRIPMRGVAGEAIREDAIDNRRVGPATHVGEEPQAIPFNRTAHAVACIPVGPQGWRLRDPRRSQLVVDIVRRGPVTRRAVERRTAEVVAARLRHDVDARPSGLGFGKAARDQYLHFLSIRGVVCHVRDAAAAERRRYGEPIGHDAPFAAGATVCAEERHRRSGRRRGCVRTCDTTGVQCWNRCQRGAVAARRRERVEYLVVQHDFTSHRLRIDQG